MITFTFHQFQHHLSKFWCFYSWILTIYLQEIICQKKRIKLESKLYLVFANFWFSSWEVEVMSLTLAKLKTLQLKHGSSQLGLDSSLLYCLVLSQFTKYSNFLEGHFFFRKIKLTLYPQVRNSTTQKTLIYTLPCFVLQFQLNSALDRQEWLNLETPM